MRKSTTLFELGIYFCKAYNFSFILLHGISKQPNRNLMVEKGIGGRNMILKVEEVFKMDPKTLLNKPTSVF